MLNRLFIILMIGIGTYVCAQNGPGKTLSTKNLEHPYLLFTNETKKDLLTKIESSEELTEILNKQLLQAERYFKLPIQTDLTIPLERSRVFDKGETFRTLSEYMHAAYTLAFAYQVTGNTAYAEKAFEYAEMLCKLDSWAYSFHKFNNIYTRVWPYNVDDDQVVFSFDLQSARTASKLSFVYDWLYPALNKMQRDRIRGALLENGVLPVRGGYEYHWWATAYKCNWSGICHSGAGLTALALLKDDPQLIDVVDRAYEGVNSMLNEIGENGGWQEGRGYWAYGISHSTWFMDAVKTLTDGKYNLFAHEKINANSVDFPLYTLGSGFGDGRGTPIGESWFINKLIAETNSHTAAFYRDNYIRNDESVYDLIWSKPDVEPIEPAVKSKLFKSIDRAVMQSAFYYDRSFSIVCEAGLNDDPHHGHLDCGQFVLNFDGKDFIRDFGHPPYDDYYFSAERWSYYLASSWGHNVIHVNDEAQISAKLKDQPWKDDVGGSITSFSTTDKTDYVSMDLAKAYPGIELKFWQRQIILEKPSVALVLDNVKTAKGNEITSRIHPGGEVEIHDTYYTIEIEGDKLAVIPVLNQSFEISKGREPSLSIKMEDTFKWIPHTDIKTISKGDNTVMGMLILSLEDDVDPGSIANSVNIKKSSGNTLEVSYKVKEQLYEYSFKVNKSQNNQLQFE